MGVPADQEDQEKGKKKETRVVSVALPEPALV